MGTRVHKVIGYGLDDVNNTTGKFDISEDDRFNPEGFFCLEEKVREERFLLKEFAIQLNLVIANNDWSDTFPLRLLLHDIEEGRFTFENFDFLMTWNPEFGMSNVCVFNQHGRQSDSFRYDNLIDYYEETINHKQENHVLLLNRPIYPNIKWVDTRTTPPKWLDREGEMTFDVIQKATEDEVEGRHEFTLTQEQKNKLARDVGFDTVTDLLDNVAPMIPEDLVEIIRYLKVFNDPSTIYTLKPMIYTYWG